MSARIPPGGPDDIGRLNHVITRVIGAAAGAGPPNVFTTLARNRTLFRRWLPFAGALMPGGSLPRAESELLILRVAHNCDSEYEWRHHEHLGSVAGLSAEEIERVRLGPDAGDWSERQAQLLRAADELHADRRISATTWDALRSKLRDHELIELCMLVGHYEMLAMTLNSLEVEPDRVPLGQPTRIMRLVRSLTDRREARRA